jgi:hypothetical protein
MLNEGELLAETLLTGADPIHTIETSTLLTAGHLQAGPFVPLAGPTSLRR